jgi:hypothetical protein
MRRPGLDIEQIRGELALDPDVAEETQAPGEDADPDAPVIVCSTKTWVRGGVDTPKSEAGERTIALGERLAAELFEHRRRSPFDGDDERVFCHPLTGAVLDPKRYARTLRLALGRAGVDRPMRPFHDGRHTSITNSAAAGISPAALMARAGHSDFGRRSSTSTSPGRRSARRPACSSGASGARAVPKRGTKTGLRRP